MAIFHTIYFLIKGVWKIFDDKIRDLIHQMNFTNGKFSQKQVFNDVVYVATYFLNNVLLDNSEHQQRYNELIAKYSKEERPQIYYIVKKLAELYQEQETPKDILGAIYNEVQGYSKGTDQYFTPEYVSDYMAQFVSIDEKELKEYGYITLPETCVGAGGLVLSYAKLMKNKGYDLSKNLFVIAWDIDIFCTYMTYVQLSLYDIPAIVINGDSLELDVNITLYTPEYYVGLWFEKDDKTIQKFSGR